MLWDEVRTFSGQDRALLAYNTDNEQGFTFRTHDRAWHPTDHEGLTLLHRQPRQTPAQHPAAPTVERTATARVEQGSKAAAIRTARTRETGIRKFPVSRILKAPGRHLWSPRMLTWQREGWSPRMRGWSLGSVRRAPATRMVPAHAGVVPARRGPSSARPSAPRIRGDGPMSGCPPGPICACSPHPWGWPPPIARLEAPS
ncbi:type I-E CRISPR-associated endoribonuclease Cas2 [Streptomyces sp. NPDC001275]